MKVALNKIKKLGLDRNDYTKLLNSLNKTKADNSIISIKYIMETIGVDNAVICLNLVNGYDKEIRLFSVWCARQVQYLMKDQRSLDALDIAEAYANNLATENELWTANVAALAAANECRSYAIGGAAWAAEGTTRSKANETAWNTIDPATWAAISDASDAVTMDVSRNATNDALRAERNALWAAARNTAYTVVKENQKSKLLEICYKG